MSESPGKLPSKEQQSQSLERYVPREILQSLTEGNQRELEEKGLTEVDISKETLPGTEREVYRPIYHFRINLKGTTAESALLIEQKVMGFFATYPDLGRIFGIRGGVDGFMNGYIRPKNNPGEQPNHPSEIDQSSLKDAVSMLSILQQEIITIGKAHKADFRSIFSVAEKQTTRVTISKFGKTDARYALDSADSLMMTGLVWPAYSESQAQNTDSHFFLVSAPSSPEEDTSIAQLGYDKRESLAKQFGPSTERRIQAPVAKAPGRSVLVHEPTIALENTEALKASAQEQYGKKPEQQSHLPNPAGSYSVISESMQAELLKNGKVNPETGSIEGKITGAHLVVKADYSGLTKLVAVANEKGQDPGKFVKEVLVNFLSPLSEMLAQKGKPFLISVEGDAVIFFISAPAEEQLALLGEINAYLEQEGNKLYEHVKKLPREFREKTGITKMGMKTIAAASLEGDAPTTIRVYNDGVLSYNTEALKLEDRMELLAKYGGNTASMTLRRRLEKEEANALFPKGWHETIVTTEKEDDLSNQSENKTKNVTEYIYSTRTARTFIEDQMDGAIREKLKRPQENAKDDLEAALLLDVLDLYKEIDGSLYGPDNTVMLEGYDNNIIGAAKMLFALNEGLQPMEGNSEDSYIQELIASFVDSGADTSHDKRWMNMLQETAQYYFHTREAADASATTKGLDPATWEQQFIEEIDALQTIPGDPTNQPITDDVRKDISNCTRLLLGIGRQLRQSRNLRTERFFPDEAETVDVYSIIASRLKMESRKRG